VFEFAWFAASTASFQATRLLAGLVSAAVLPPQEFAVWGVVLIALNYTNYLNLGLLSAANRDIPILLGRGDAGGADSIESAANGAMSLLAFAVFLASIVMAWIAQSWLFLTVGVTVAIQQLYLLQQVALKSRLHFNRASVQQALLAVAFPVVCLALIGVLGVGALVIGQGAAYAAAVLTVALRWPPRRPTLALASVAGLVIRGFPIMLAGFLFAALSTTDRWFVLTFYGKGALGTYTLANILSSALLFIAILVAQQSYPRLAMSAGTGAAASELRRQATIQSSVAVGLALPVSLTVVAVAPAVVPAVFPSYAGSVPAIQILALGMLAMIGSTGFTNLLVTTGHAWLYVALVAACIVIQAAVAWIAYLVGLGPEGIAGSAALSYLALLITSVAAVRRAL
jgi:O-antigen/teichoic acid export membrane protein